MNNNSITMLMKKVTLPNLVYLYYPVHYLIGDYNEDEGIFYEDNDEYLEISNGGYEINEVNYGVMNTTPFKDIKKIYNVDTEEEAIKCYTDEYRNLVYLMSYDLETANSIVNEIDLASVAEGNSIDDLALINLDDNKMVQIQTQAGEEMLAINMNSYFKDLKELAQVFEEESFTREQKEIVKKEIKEIIDCFQTVEKSLETNTKTKTISKKQKPSESNIDEKEIFNIEKIYKELTSSVIAQDEPAERFVVEICRMILSNQRNGILLTGSTGVGKTELIKCLGKAIDRPVLVIDSTQITAPAFVGRNIEEFLYDLIVQCDGNISKAEKAIVVFDEIDKKGSTKKDDPNGRAVLNTLLKFLDGTVYKASPNQQNLMREPIQINTSNMIVIGCGAFNDVYKQDKPRSVGFNSVPIKEKQPTIDDFCEKAMMPDEFMGRFPIVIKLNYLSIDDLKAILIKSKNNTLKEQRELFKNCGVALKVNEGYLNAIAKKAYERGTGARSLKSEITETTWKPFEIVKQNTNVYSKVELTEDTVEDINNYKLVKRRVKKDK